MSKLKERVAKYIEDYSHAYHIMENSLRTFKMFNMKNLQFHADLDNQAWSAAYDDFMDALSLDYTIKSIQKYPLKITEEPFLRFPEQEEEDEEEEEEDKNPLYIIKLSKKSVYDLSKL